LGKDNDEDNDDEMKKDLVDKNDYESAIIDDYDSYREGPLSFC
jgi:hypothetical protein